MTLSARPEVREAESFSIFSVSLQKSVDKGAPLYRFGTAKLYVLVVHVGARMSDNFRANLEACWLNAERASSERERRAWLEMAAAWRLLVAIGDPPSTPEYRIVVERSPPLANRLIKISNRRQWWTRQVGAHISKCRALLPFNARTLSIHSFIQIMVHARRSAGRAAELVRALF